MNDPQQAQPEREAEPSAQGPAELWLQLHGDCLDCELDLPVDFTSGDVTWCWHQINNSDVRYVRADLASHPSPVLVEAARKGMEALEAALTMSDRGDMPQKLDDALTWRENDELARSKVDAAIAALRSALDEQGAALPAGVALPEVPSKPLNGIRATWTHDEGAYAQCGDCGRYSADPDSLRRHTFGCECGSLTGWSGSFKKPGPDAKWSGSAPGVEEGAK